MLVDYERNFLRLLNGILFFLLILSLLPLPISAQEATTLRFAVIGDYGSNTINEARVAAMVASWDLDFILTVGDNNYPDGAADTIDDNIGQYYSQFIGNYQGQYGAGSPVNRFWPTLGNHDWTSIQCNPDGCTGSYLDYFTLPGNEFYYDVDYGLLRLFALDSDYRTPGGIQPNSEQGNWLQSQLAASDACFNVVFFHAAPYASGYHGSYAPMQWPFATWGADVVLSGHDHVYERLEVDGIPYFVNGVGGQAVYSFANIDNLPAEATSLFRYNDDFGAMLVTVTESGLTSQFFNADGRLIDEYTLTKSCPLQPTPTTMPSATPSSTSTATPSPTATTLPTPTASLLPTETATPNSTKGTAAITNQTPQIPTPTPASPLPQATGEAQTSFREHIMSWLSSLWNKIQDSITGFWN